jgi:NAD(P)-dependent dehydrogenase (short-subunit alcohol dehydrogenase family)
MVTGVTHGIGKATALGLARTGATVILVARDPVRGEATLQEIRRESGNSDVDLLIADLSSQKAIRQLAKDFQQRYTALHVLIHTAGVFLLKRQESVDGLEMTFAVNHLAPFLLTNLLLDVLKSSAPARIINVASEAHRSGDLKLDDLQTVKQYNVWRAYARSKLAMVLCSYELARTLQGTGVTVNCVHPGFVSTNMGMNNVGPTVQKVAKFILSHLGTSPEEGAKTSFYLATSPEVQDVSGKYFAKCIPKRSAPISYNKALQRQMWEESAKLVYLHY